MARIVFGIGQCPSPPGPAMKDSSSSQPVPGSRGRPFEPALRDRTGEENDREFGKRSAGCWPIPNKSMGSQPGPVGVARREPVSRPSVPTA